jgi:hypothetical protein
MVQSWAATEQGVSRITCGFEPEYSSNPQGTDKGDLKTYVRGCYETEFCRLRRSGGNRLHEVGVRTSALLALWANYFIDLEIIGGRR